VPRDDFAVRVEQCPQPVGPGLPQPCNGAVGRRLIVRQRAGGKVTEAVGVRIPGRPDSWSGEGCSEQGQEQDRGWRAGRATHGIASVTGVSIVHE
jgi:hypothetical protein